MASNGNSRGKLLTAGGILSIVAGVYLFVVGQWVSALMILPIGHEVLYYSPFPPFIVFSNYSWWGNIANCVIIMSIVAIVGGSWAIKRKRFGLSLAGAICALPSILGIPAVIFVVLGKRAFKVVN